MKLKYDHKERPCFYDKQETVNDLFITWVKYSLIGLAILFSSVYALEWLAGI